MVVTGIPWVFLYAKIETDALMILEGTIAEIFKIKPSLCRKYVEKTKMANQCYPSNLERFYTSSDCSIQEIIIRHLI